MTGKEATSRSRLTMDRRPSLRTRFALVLAAFIVVLAFVGTQALQSVHRHRDERLAAARLDFQRRLVTVAWEDLDEAARLIDAGSFDDVRRVRSVFDRALVRFHSEWAYAIVLGGDVRARTRLVAALQTFDESMAALTKDVDAGRVTDPEVYLSRVRRAVRAGRDDLAVSDARQRLGSSDVVLHSSDELLWWMAAFFGVSILATGSLWALVHFGVTARLAKLGDAITRYGADGVVLDPPASDDEIGRLGRSFQDLTRRLSERFETESRLREQLVVHERLAAVGELASAVAHGLGNPLASIRALAELGAATSEGEHDERYREIIQLVDRIRVHIDDLLLFARGGERYIQPVDVNAIVRNVVSLLEPMCIGRGAHLAVDLTGESLMIEADAADFERALLAVVENAIEASDSHQEVRVKTRGGDADVFVTISDRGPGIAREHRERVFDPYFSTKQQGRGIGLTVARRVAASVHGELSIEAGDGGGTVVAFRLPRMPEAAIA